MYVLFHDLSLVDTDSELSSNLLNGVRRREGYRFLYRGSYMSAPLVADIEDLT